MKKFTLLAAVLISLLNSYGQAPQKIAYSAEIRDNSGNLVAPNTPVALLFNIHNLSATGDIVFYETTDTKTDNYGMVNVEIGTNNNSVRCGLE